MDETSPPITAQTLARQLGLTFKNIMLLQRALTHRSYINEHPEALEDNERLEFLGDAVLDFLVGAWLYNRFPEMQEGELTRMRAAIVGTKQLAIFGDELNIGGAILLGRGEETNGGRARPLLICSTFEAIIGALYLDSGMEAVRNFINPLLPSVAEKIISSTGGHDPKSLLQEWAQANGHGVPRYSQVDAHGPDHKKTFVYEVRLSDEPYGLGEGSSKQSATKKAAQNALEKIASDNAPSKK